MGVTPDQLLKLLERADVFLRADINLKKCELIEEIDLQDGNPLVEIYSCLFNSPASFVAGRFFVDVKYTWKDEMMSLCTSDGNDHYKEQFLKEKSKEIKGMSPAFCRLTGFKFFPVTDHEQRVVGTKVVLAAQFDYGGSIPKWLINKMAPSNILSFYEQFIRMGQQI